MWPALRGEWPPLPPLESGSDTLLGRAVPSCDSIFLWTTLSVRIAVSARLKGMFCVSASSQAQVLISEIGDVWIMAPGPRPFLFLGAFGERSGFVLAQDRRGLDAKTAKSGPALTYYFL